MSEGYLIEDGGLRAAKVYDNGYAGESVLLSPTGPGSFKALEGQAEEIAGGPFTSIGISQAGAFYNHACQRTLYTDLAFASAAAATRTG